MVLIVMHGKRVVAQSCNTPHEPEDDRGADGGKYNGNRDACALLSELGGIAVECAVDVHARVVAVRKEPNEARADHAADAVLHGVRGDGKRWWIAAESGGGLSTHSSRQ